MVIVRDVEAQAREEGDKRARKIIAIAMQRVASELTTEAHGHDRHAAERGHEGPDHRP